MTRELRSNLQFLQVDVEDYLHGCRLDENRLLNDCGTCLMDIDYDLAQRCIHKTWRSSQDRTEELVRCVRYVLEKFFGMSGCVSMRMTAVEL